MYINVTHGNYKLDIFTADASGCRLLPKKKPKQRKRATIVLEMYDSRHMETMKSIDFFRRHIFFVGMEKPSPEPPISILCFN